MPMILVLALHALCAAASSAPAQWPATSPLPRWQGSDAWRSADFAILHSELSPAVLISSKSSTLRLFAGLERWGLGGPTMLAFRTREGCPVLLAPATASGRDMASPWLLVSFTGGPGWDPWDTPWLVVLQHRPTRIAAGTDGLAVTFDGAAGLVATMPLYSGIKLPAREARLDLWPQAGDEQGWLWDVMYPWLWLRNRALSDRAAEKCEMWAHILRYWPVNCREEIQVVPASSLLRVRSTYDFVEVRDDWQTRGAKIAPIAPTLGLALRPGFPGDAGKPVGDLELELFSAYGETLGQEGDTCTVEFPLLQYITETETQQPPNPENPVVALAAQRVAEVMTSKFTDGSEGRIWDHGGGGNFCWQAMGDRYYAKALAYTPEPARSNAIACLRSYFRNWVLNPEKYQPFRDKLLLVGPGIGTWGGYDDAGKFSSNVLETLWCYAHYTGDWQLIKERWDMVKKLFITPREMRWRGVGRDAIAEMGDEAAPPLCMARMAYVVGDMDMFAYASFIFVRELVHLWVKTNPECAEWFRSFQPWHNTEPMKGRLFLTNLWGDVAGWQIDGPDYPRETGERQYRNRWVRFGNEDVARFFRDHMATQVRQELDWWATREDSPYKPGQSTAHIASSIEQLRSLLLNESPEVLAKLAPMQNVRIGRAADAISYYLSFIRTGRETKTTQLIPDDLPPSPWILGLEREAEGSDGDLAVHVSTGDDQWPVLSDYGWAPPKETAGPPGGKRWSYGQIIAGDAPAVTLKYERLSWTTEAWYTQ